MAKPFAFTHYEINLLIKIIFWQETKIGLENLESPCNTVSVTLTVSSVAAVAERYKHCAKSQAGYHTTAQAER